VDDRHRDRDGLGQHRGRRARPLTTPTAQPPVDLRPRLDARVAGDQVFLVADDDRLRDPPPELRAVVGPRAEATLRSFWVPPHGFERRWAVAVDPALAFPAVLETGWPVAPALGALLELTVECLRIANAGTVVPGPIPGLPTGWVAAPDRRTAAGLRDAVVTAGRHHDAAEHLADLLVDAFATARLGPVPDPLLDRTPTPTYRAWLARLRARRAAGARLVLRLDPEDGFVVTPCVQGRRARTLTIPVDTRAPGTLDAAARELGVEPDRIDRLVLAEWAAVTRAWPLLVGVPCAAVELDVDDLVALVERYARPLEQTGIDLLLPVGFLTKRRSTRTLRVDGRPAGLAVESLTLTGEVRIGGVALTDDELAGLLASPHDVVRVGGAWTHLAAGERERIAEFVRKLGAADAGTVLDAVADAAMADDTDVEIDLPADSWLTRALAGSWQPTRAERVPAPDLLALPLRHYQRDGLDWMVWLEHNGLGGILADDMGLGKTAMLLALVAHDFSAPAPAARAARAPLTDPDVGAPESAARSCPPGPTLVVAPTSVVGNWEREAARFTPGLRVVVHHGRERGDPSAIVADLVITSYGMLRLDPRLADVGWHRVILDEAQAIKNPQTATAKAARALPATHRVAATGTPVENDLDELWSIMAFACPGLLGARKTFAQQYRPTGDLDADANALAHLRARIAAFVCRRTKLDPGIVDELPDRVVVRDDCLLTREQVAMYERTTADLLGDLDEITDTRTRRLHVLAGLTRLKQICNHPASIDPSDTSELAGRSGKLDRLVELVEEIAAEGEAVVVFTQYATFLQRMAVHLSEQVGLPVPVLHGGVTRARRDRIVEAFTAGHGAGVLAVSLRAGGTGLNLVRANHVVHVDRWWNPAVEDQASDRVWRIGQTRGVVVHTLVCPGTIEDRIATLIESKRALAGAVITSSEQTVTALDPTELAAFVALDVDAATRR
jgi:non-specific serine/threonine protein kinase